MTEMGNGEGQGSVSGQAPVTPSSAPSQSASGSQGNEERSFKQSEVNELVGRAKHEAVERYKRDTAMSSHQSSPQQQNTYPVYQQPSYQQPPAGNQNGYGQQPQQQQQSTDYRQVVAEETQRLWKERELESAKQAENQAAKRIADEFFTKIDAGKTKYEDFDQVMGNVDLRAIPYHVQLANMVDNTADVMYELAKNPHKIGQLQNLIDIDFRAGRNPKLALAEMQKLSDSIKKNSEASKFKSPNEPLSQLRPTNAGADKNGPLSVSDYKRKYRV